MTNTRINLPGVKGAYVIATADALEELKKRADLVLPGNPEEDFKLLRNAFSTLRQLKKSSDAPLKVELVGSTITFPEGAALDLSNGFQNLYLYGNGVKFKGNIESEYLFSVVDCWLYDITVENAGDEGYGISANNSTLTNCNGTGGYGDGIYANNSTLSNCEGSGGYYGINANNSTLSNCEGSGGYYGIDATNSALSNCNGYSSGEAGISANNSTLTNCSGSGEYGDGIYAYNSTLSNCEGSGGYYGIYASISTLTNCIGNGVSQGIYALNSTLSNCDGTGDNGSGIGAKNSTLSNCIGSSDSDNGIDVLDSTLSNCSGKSGAGDKVGIYATDSTLSNCSGSAEEGIGIFASGSCTIQGCDGTEGGISVPEGFVGIYPNTLALLQAFNKGVIIEREDEE